MVGRQRRFRNFNERAQSFYSDVRQGQGYKEIRREQGHTVAPLLVGIGKHRRLVFKINPSHAMKAGDYHDKLVQDIDQRGYGAGSYELVKPEFVVVGRNAVVQEYFDKPTLRELERYLLAQKEVELLKRRVKKPASPEELMKPLRRFVDSKESALRCKRFLKDPKNAGVDLARIREVGREFEEHSECKWLWIKPANVIVLGQVRQAAAPKMRIAIIDY